MLKALPQATVTFVLLVQVFSVQGQTTASTSTTSTSTFDFPLEYIDRCSPVELTEAEGMFISPIYPRLFYNRAVCTWHITVKSGSRVELHVQIDKIDPSKGDRDHNCTYDAIVVYDGADENATLLAKECGKDKNMTVLSTGNELFVVFKAYWIKIPGRDGFIANYVTISPGITKKF